MSEPSAPSSPARLGSRIWGTFSFLPAESAATTPLRPENGEPRIDRYALDEVVVVKGPGLGAVAPGWSVTRVESQAPAPATGAALSLVGTTQHVQYTSGDDQAELLRISTKASGKVAVLIPIAKSEAWWSLPQDRRVAHFRPAPGDRRPGHTGIGARYAGRIFRRLYHARYLPRSTWDFLTYFEMQPEHVAHFRQLLGELRDPNTNPEWAFVEREVELWMRRV